MSESVGAAQSPFCLQPLERYDDADGPCPRLGEGGFLETESLADVDVIAPRGRLVGSVAGEGYGANMTSMASVPGWKPYLYGRSRLSLRPAVNSSGRGRRT